MRRVKAGLGGHDAGVSGVDEGVSMTPFPISKRGRLVMSDCQTLSCFVRSGNEDTSENQTESTSLAYNDVSLTIIDMSSHLSAVENSYCGVFAVSVFCHFVDISQRETKKEKELGSCRLMRQIHLNDFYFHFENRSLCHKTNECRAI